MYAGAMDSRSTSPAAGRASSSSAQSIMIAFDGRPNAERAITYVGHFLRASTAHVVTAWQPGTLHPTGLSSMSAGIQPFVDTTTFEADVDDALREEAAEINERGVRLAGNAGLAATGTLVEVESTVWGALVAAADALDVDLLVTGTRGSSGFKALLHSGVAERVLKHCHRPVFIVPATCDKAPPVIP
ncbi:MAG: universal stress protein [Gordonia sp. (in: high G+C Gram-positive bacteria)]